MMMMKHPICQFSVFEFLLLTPILLTEMDFWFVYSVQDMVNESCGLLIMTIQTTMTLMSFP